MTNDTTSSHRSPLPTTERYQPRKLEEPSNALECTATAAPRKLLVIVQGGWFSTRRQFKHLLARRFRLLADETDEGLTTIEAPSSHAGVALIEIRLLGNNWRYHASRTEFDLAVASGNQIIVAPLGIKADSVAVLRRFSDAGFSVKIFSTDHRKYCSARFRSSDGQWSRRCDADNDLLGAITEFAQQENLLTYAFGY